MAHIYVSSTFSDLKDYREQVRASLRRLGHIDVAMENYVAEDIRPLDRCLIDVEKCDVYVGIFAWRYGHVPKEKNPESRSITELEYRQAFDAGKTCLIFLLSEDADWPKSKQDRRAEAERIETFREHLIGCERHIVEFFETGDELARKVNEAVSKWERDTGREASRPLADWDTYREAVRERHQWVRMQVIAGVSKSREPVRIPLTDVFEPQLITAGASCSDVPDEVIQYQREIYKPQSDVSPSTEEVPDDVIQQATLKSDENPFESMIISEPADGPELVLEMLGRERTQVILGGPGTGKSTILLYAMMRLCDTSRGRDVLPEHLTDTPIPFLVELRSFVLSGESNFLAHIVKRSNEYYNSQLELEHVTAILAATGQAIVFFDGLDEVFDLDDRRRVLESFIAFSHRYPKARIVVTSRIAGYDRTALGTAGFNHYTLLPLTLAQIKHFAEGWYRYYSLEGTERTAQGLAQRIQDNPRLLDLAGNPLLLTMMAVIYRDRDLPQERWKLYERCADTLLEDWDIGKGIRNDPSLKIQIHTAQKSEILQAVSMYMLERGQPGRELNAIAYGPLLHIIATYLQVRFQKTAGDAETIAVDILRHLMERTYILAGTGERIFGFVHRTFMEYFAARHCLAQFNARKSDFKWLNQEIYGKCWQKDDWTEVLLLLIAMLHDQGTPVTEVIQSLRSKQKLSPPLNISFAALCLGEAGTVTDIGAAQSLIAELAKHLGAFASQLRRDKAKAFIAAGLKAFASLALQAPVPTAVHRIIRNLDAEGTANTRIIAWQMGFAMRAPQERLHYALCALENDQELVRRAAIAALEREWPGRLDIRSALTKLVQHDRQAQVRQAALDALQRAWQPDLEILDAIARRIPKETGHRNMVRLIQYISSTWGNYTRARDLIIEMGNAQPNTTTYFVEEVRVVAAHRLARMWPRSEAAFNAIRQWVETRPTLDRHYYHHYQHAIFSALALGWAGNINVLDMLITDATMNSESAIRAAATESIAMGWHNKENVLELLVSIASINVAI